MSSTRINFAFHHDPLDNYDLEDSLFDIDLSAAERLFKDDQRFQSLVDDSTFEVLSEERDLFRIWTISIPDKDHPDEVLKVLKSHDNIEFAVFEQKFDFHEVQSVPPNDPGYTWQWNLHRINVETGWKKSTGKNVIVAVIDTGVDYNHPDIADNMWQDRNGNFGRDFVRGSNNTNDPIDIDGHGTKVAGIIASVTNNKVGIAGVAPDAKIMSVKIGSTVGDITYDSRIARALKYAVDSGAKVLNCSWGKTDRNLHSPVLELAIYYVYASGGICVFAAGNENDDIRYYSPQNLGIVITVGSTDEDDDRLPGSNYGDQVNVAAPGGDIDTLGTEGRYTKGSGTSMAAPHVSGAIALLLSYNNDLRFFQILKYLEMNSHPITTDRYVGKRLDLTKLFNEQNFKYAYDHTVDLIL